MEMKTYDIKIQVPSAIDDIQKIFTGQGLDLFLVGGCVRDAVLKENPKDFDLATNATPDKIESIFRGRYQTKLTGKSFGVINVITDDGTFELATFREDGPSADGRRPGSVVFSTIDQDVLRRDFTINALFYDLNKKLIIDLVGGVSDLLENKRIRTVGSADLRFEEDRLRILRAVRFQTRLGYELDEDIERSILQNNSLANLSRERVRDEIVKTLVTSKNPMPAFATLRRLGLLEEVFPGLNTDVELTCGSDVVRHETMLAILLHKNKSEVLKKKLSALCYTHQEIKDICFLVDLISVGMENIYELKNRQSGTTLDDSEITGFCKVLFEDKLPLIEKFLQWKLSIKGDDLKEKGFLEGREIGAEIRRREMEIIKTSINLEFSN